MEKRSRFAPSPAGSEVGGEAVGAAASSCSVDTMLQDSKSHGICGTWGLVGLQSAQSKPHTERTIPIKGSGACNLLSEPPSGRVL